MKVVCAKIALTTQSIENWRLKVKIMTKECKMGYYDLNGEYQEVDLKSRKEVILTFKTRFIETDDNYLIFESIDGRDEIFINGDDICGIEED